MGAVYLVRHGQASFGAEDYDVLSPAGERQAKAVGAALAERGVRPLAAWSGTLVRQRGTAALAVAAAGYGLPVREDPRWNEYDHLGLAGAHSDPLPTDPRGFQAVLDRALLAWASADGSGPGTFRDFADGATAALAEVGRDGTALVVTSGGVIAAIAAALTGAGPQALVALNRVVVNAAVTKVVIGRSGASLVSFNEHAHFEGASRDLLTYR